MEIVFPPSYTENTFQEILHQGKRGVFFATQKSFDGSALKLNLVQDLILPFINMYEVNLECNDGLNIGYYFQLLSKNSLVSPNYIVTFNPSRIADKYNDKLELKLKMRKLKLFTLGRNAGSLITLGSNQILKEVLEL